MQGVRDASLIDTVLVGSLVATRDRPAAMISALRLVGLHHAGERTIRSLGERPAAVRGAGARSLATSAGRRAGLARAPQAFPETRRARPSRRSSGPRNDVTARGPAASRAREEG